MIKKSTSNKFKFKRKLVLLRTFFNKITFPGFESVPLLYVVEFFFKGLKKGALTTRASAIAFNFLLAMGPAIIFLLTIIPYLPVENFKNDFFVIMHDIMPNSVFSYFENIFAELSLKKSGLPLFGFATAMFFATKGISSMIGAFNATYHTLETRPFFERTVVALFLVIIFFTLLFISVILIFFSKSAISFLADHSIIKTGLLLYLIVIGKWILVIGLTFLAISFLYFLAPQRKTKWKFISVGSSLATLLTLSSVLIFSYFINNFANLNQFFGSIGALIALMLWLNFIALSLLIGFELNASIKNAEFEHLK
jgi:membrane protein